MKDLWKDESEPSKNSSSQGFQNREGGKMLSDRLEPVSVKNMHDMLPQSSV